MRRNKAKRRLLAASIAAACIALIVFMGTACAPKAPEPSQEQAEHLINDDIVPLVNGLEDTIAEDIGQEVGTEQGTTTEPTGTEEGTTTEPTGTEEGTTTEPTGTEEGTAPEQEVELGEAGEMDMAVASLDENAEGAEDDADSDELSEEEQAELEAQALAEEEAARLAAEEEERARAAAEEEARARAEAAYDLNERVYDSPIKSGVYIIRFCVAVNKVLDAAGTTSGSNVQLYTANNTDAQAWYLKIDARGLYTIINMKSNLALHSSGMGTSSGTNIVLAKQNGSNAQKFIIQKNGIGYEIIPIYTKAYGVEDLSIDVKGGSTANKTNVHLWDSNDGNAQKFTFSNVTSRYNTPSKAVQVMTSAARAGAASVDVERYCFSYSTLQQAYNLWSKGQSPKRYTDSYTQNVRLVYSDSVTLTKKAVDPNTGEVVVTKIQKPANSLFFRYTYSKSTIDKMVSAQNRVQKTVVAKAKKIKDPVKRAKYLHDWIARNVKYDYKATSDLAWTTYAAAVKKSSRCLGYSTLYRDLCNKAGLNCSVVVGRNSKTGRAAEHAWNKIIVKGKTYYVDTTWDVNSKKRSKPRSTYFMKTAAWMKSHKHILD